MEKNLVFYEKNIVILQVLKTGWAQNKNDNKMKGWTTTGDNDDYLRTIYLNVG